MKMNNKGFMMAEVIVVSTVVLGVLISIYTSYNKVFTKYSEINNYYNIDGVYRLASIRDTLIVNNQIKNYFGSSSGYKQYEKGNNNEIVYFFTKEYISSGNFSALNNIDIGYQDYLSYLRDAIEYEYISDYIMVIEWKENNNYYYNYLELEA